LVDGEQLGRGVFISHNLSKKTYAPQKAKTVTLPSSLHHNSPQSGLVQPCDPPNTYPLARRVLGHFAPDTRRASSPVPVIADVRKIKENMKTLDFGVLCALGDFARETIFRNRRITEGAHRPLIRP